MTTNGSTGGEEAWHVTQFIRRHGPGDGLRIASSVLYATIGVIETQMGRNNETMLVRAIAGEIHRIAGHLLCHQQHLQEEGESLHRGTKRLSAEEVVQWEQQVREEEQEVEETAMTLEETGGEDMLESDAHSPTSTANSHRRRRMLAMHHKEFIGEDGGGTDDEHCLMAMGRYASSSSSQNGEPSEEAPQEREEEEEINGTTGRTGEMESDQEEDTNLDEELRQILPNPETTASMGECSNVRAGALYSGDTATAHRPYPLAANKPRILGISTTDLGTGASGGDERGGHPAVDAGASFALRAGNGPPESPLLGGPLPPAQSRGSAAM